MSNDKQGQENQKWEAVIGLEVHVQLATESKAFSPSAVRYGAEPNSLTDPTVLGLPGALPVFNAGALRAAIKLGLAVGSTIRTSSRFARKHYFYPDLPKGYQISQFDEPICEGGGIEIERDGEPFTVPLTRIHLEEDAGKSNHLGRGKSLVDLNRAGVPLCEVVSEPEIRTAQEAADYMRSLRQLVRYLGISEGDMEKGHLRCDANVSIRPRGQEEYGTRTELKNINSFKFVEKAIEHEIARQIALVESGEEVVQETRLWDSDVGVSRSMRGKEEAMDYRYFPDPDLPPLEVSDEEIEALRRELPELPGAARKRLVELGLSDDDAAALTVEGKLLTYFDQAHESLQSQAKVKGGAKLIANWLLVELLGLLNKESVSIDASPVSPEALAGLVALVADDTISGKIGKKVLPKIYETGDSAKDIVEREGLVQITDTGAIEEVIKGLIEANPKQVQQFKEGNEKILGFFVGQVMKATKGQANPKIANQLLRKLLSE